MDHLIGVNASRREFVSNSLKVTAAISVLPTSMREHSVFNQLSKGIKTTKINPLRILILGGTTFLGPHQIAYALGRGHKITTFTRGRTKPTIYTELFDEVEQLIGDRESNLEALNGREWDAVIDNSGYRSDWTKATAKLLKDKVGLYLYTSSVHVFYPYEKVNLKEDDEVNLSRSERLEIDRYNKTYKYGLMKARSELEVRKYFGDDGSIIVRPTIITGPADPGDNFMYWPTQLAKGGDIIVPGKVNDRVQYIDVRDVAEFMVRLIENKTTGIFHGVGPASPMTLPAYVHGAHAVFGTNVKYHYINDYDFLEDIDYNAQSPWVRDRKKYHGFSQINNEHAIINGLTFRPLAQTINDTHNWWFSDAVSEERREAFNSEFRQMHNRQAALLAAWGNYRRKK